MMMTGRISSARAIDPPMTTFLFADPHQGEEPEGQHAVDDRRYGGEVLDVELEEPVVPAVPVGELLQVDRGGHPERYGE